MGNCWLAVVGRSYPGVGYGLAKVQKRKRRLADLQGVFERRMISGPKSIKFSRFCRVPEDAPSTSSIDITFVELRLVSLVIFKHLPLTIANEETSIVWAYFRSHGYAPKCNLPVVFTVKFKWRTSSASRTSVCWWLLQRTQIEVVLQSLQAIIVWDHYGVEGLNVHS